MRVTFSGLMRRLRVWSAHILKSALTSKDRAQAYHQSVHDSPPAPHPPVHPIFKWAQTSIFLVWHEVWESGRAEAEVGMCCSKVSGCAAVTCMSVVVMTCVFLSGVWRWRQWLRLTPNTLTSSLWISLTSISIRVARRKTASPPGSWESHWATFPTLAWAS